MRLLIIAAALTLCACTQPQPQHEGPIQPVAIDAPSGEYTLDPTHTSVLVRARHFGLSNYTLRMADVSGTLNFSAEDPAQSSVNVSVGANSVRTEYVGQRDFNAELENSQWLDADAHPALTFQSTEVTLTGPNTGRMTGDLTIRGVTHPITFDVTFNKGYPQHPMGLPMALLGFSAHGSFKRSDYGMRVLLPLAEGGAGVSDEVEVVIETEFNRQIAPAPAPQD